MRKKHFDFAVIGGDLRFTYLADLLSEQGYQVIAYGLAPGTNKIEYEKAAGLRQAVESADIVIGPIPLAPDGSNILQKGTLKDLTLDNLRAFLLPGQAFFAGCISEEFATFCNDKGVCCYDFMEDDTVAVFNTIATAEGVIAETIINHPGNIQKSKCLVLGFGKCGKTLAKKLNDLAAYTTVCARKISDRVYAETLGHESISFEELEDKLPQYDLIYNTVPSLILDEQALKNIEQDTMIFDIASAPGGVDFEIAKELGITAGLYLGLPGKYAPKASALMLAKCILFVRDQQS